MCVEEKIRYTVYGKNTGLVPCTVVGILEAALYGEGGIAVSLKCTGCFCKGMRGGVGTELGEAQPISTKRPSFLWEDNTAMGRYSSVWSLREGWFKWKVLVWAGVDPGKHGCEPESRRRMAGGRGPQAKQGGRTLGSSTLDLERLVF